MYSNRAIRGIKKLRQRLNRDLNTPQYKSQIKKDLQVLRSSHCYWMGDFDSFRERMIEKFDGKTPFKSSDISHVVMPFSKIVIFFTSHAGTVIHGIIVEQVATDLIRLQHLGNVKSSNQWILLPIYETFSCEGKSLREAGVKLESKDYPNTNRMRASTAVGYAIERLSDDYGKTFIAMGTFVTNYFFCMRNIKNIAEAVVEKDRPKTRESCNKDSNLFEYRILEVKRPGKKRLYRYTHQQIESRGTQPFQEIPSHEKTYNQRLLCNRTSVI
jgi:hypothetical protein